MKFMTSRETQELIPIGFVFHLGLDLSAKITECQTAAELTALENLYVLNERAQEMVFERKLEIVCRVAEWRIDNVSWIRL